MKSLSVVSLLIGLFLCGLLVVSGCVVSSPHTDSITPVTPQPTDPPPKSLGTVPTMVENQTASRCRFIAVSAGSHQSLALRDDGKVVAWGDPNELTRNVPKNLDNVTAISTGGWHNLALLGNGTVVAWGISSNGDWQIPSGLHDVVAIAAGTEHSLAQKKRRIGCILGTVQFGAV